MALAIQLPVREDQNAFNLRRWDEVMAEPLYARLDGRFETDRYGKVIHEPPPPVRHGMFLSKLGYCLVKLMSGGVVAMISPISTLDGVKCADVIWLTAEQGKVTRDVNCLPFAPALCVEIKSPSNTWRELEEKKALYFEAGATEVWVCEEDGTMRFFRDPEGEAVEASGVCPEFPKVIEV